MTQSASRVLAAILAIVFAAALVPGCVSAGDHANKPASQEAPAIAERDTQESIANAQEPSEQEAAGAVDLADIPAYAGNPYIEIANNEPSFTAADLVRACFEDYAPLDNLGRCGAAFAHICPNVMPTEERGSIGEVRPSGWHLDKYDFIDDKYLYNRCHLIGFQLAGENANECNLITGTRYMNTEGMLPFENEVADYVKATGNSVLFRVTPLFEGDNLVAKGVQMEALSVEDEGEGVKFNVFCYNVQPGVAIDYATGNHHADGSHNMTLADPSNGAQSGQDNAATPNGVAPGRGNGSYHHNETHGHHGASQVNYIANTNSKKFHYPSCASVKDIAAHNCWEYCGTREELLSQGYVPCKRCHP